MNEKRSLIVVITALLVVLAIMARVWGTSGRLKAQIVNPGERESNFTLVNLEAGFCPEYPWLPLDWGLTKCIDVYTQVKLIGKPRINPGNKGTVFLYTVVDSLYIDSTVADFGLAPDDEGYYQTSWGRFKVIDSYNRGWGNHNIMGTLYYEINNDAAERNESMQFTVKVTNPRTKAEIVRLNGVLDVEIRIDAAEVVVNLKTDEGYWLQTNKPPYVITQPYVYSEDGRLKMYVKDLVNFMDENNNYEFIGIDTSTENGGEIRLNNPQTDDNKFNDDETMYFVYFAPEGENFAMYDSVGFNYSVTDTAGGTLNRQGTINFDNGDGDGVSESAELKYGTDPHNPDTDGDGRNDLDELMNEYVILPMIKEFTQTTLALQKLEEKVEGNVISSTKIIPITFLDEETNLLESIDAQVTQSYDLNSGISTVVSEMPRGNLLQKKETRYPDGMVEVIEYTAIDITSRNVTKPQQFVREFSFS